MKKLLMFFCVFCSFYLFAGNVKANSINSIDMDIYIDSNGNGHVTEVWNAYLDQGTEGYKPYYNLGNSTITDFTVSEGDINYTNIGNWNVNASMDSKTNKNGINYTNDGLELCFGIGQYGSKQYTLKYTINNFVSQLNDSQMAYWTIFPKGFSSSPGHVYVKVHSDFSYSQDLPVWGFGYDKGYAYVYDGYIEMDSKDSINSNEYMTLLVKFPNSTFNLTNVINKDFDYYLNMAKKGSSQNSEIKRIFYIIINLIKFLFVIIALKFGLRFLNNFLFKNTTISSNFTKFKKQNVSNDVPYFRDIPCNKDILRAYFVADSYNLMDKKTDFLGVILLKWLKEGKIKLSTVETGLIFKKDSTVINLTPGLIYSNELEKKLFDMIYEASKDGNLESREFEKWCKVNYDKILNWFDNVLACESKILINEGKVIEVEEKILGFIPVKIKTLDSSMYEEAKQLKGLKKYLLDFSNIKDRQAIEVMIWEEYLMYAQLFGIAKEVAQEFKKIYPNVIMNNQYNYESIIFLNEISYAGMSRAISSKSAASRASSYHSGGGGFSSSGGGGGSFGGGGRGGGGFR